MGTATPHTSDHPCYGKYSIRYHILSDLCLRIACIIRSLTREIPSLVSSAYTRNARQHSASTASIFAKIDPKKTGAIPFFIGNQLSSDNNTEAWDGNPSPAKILNTIEWNKAASPSAKGLASAEKNVLKQPLLTAEQQHKPGPAPPIYTVCRQTTTTIVRT